MATLTPVPVDEPLKVGMLLFPNLDQLDFTGPFEVFSRMPNSTVHLIWKSTNPVHDVRGLGLLPTITFSDSPRLDVLFVPGGPGQQALMDDAEVLGFLREQARTARCVVSVCTGSLILGAAGLLKGRRATTHWFSHSLLPYLGATPVKERIVVDGTLVTCGGVTSGIDGALKVVAMLRGQAAAQEIQLYMEYAPDPPFDSGSPEAASPGVLESVRRAGQALFEARLETCRRLSGKLQPPGQTVVA